MAVSTLTSFPSVITAGETIRLTLSAGSDYPATSWTGHLGILGPGTDKRGTWEADGDSHKFTFESGTTSSWLPGDYTWTFMVQENSTNERKKIGGGTFYTTRDPLAAVPYKSHNEKVLDGLKAWQEERAAGRGAETFSIDGQTFTITTAREMGRQIGLYEMKVRRERNRELARTTGRPKRTIVFPA